MGLIGEMVGTEVAVLSTLLLRSLVHCSAEGPTSFRVLMASLGSTDPLLLC
jgi:hypothetical protein